MIAAEGVEFIGMAHRAQAGHVYPRGLDAGGHELAPVSLGQVDVRAPRGSEMRCDFRSHFVTAFPDARPDSRMEVFGPRAEALPHGFDRMAHDARHRTAPSGVHGGHRAMARVRQQNGDAIGRAHRHHRARRVFEQGVGLAENSGSALGGHARRGMDLFQQAEAGVESGDIYNARAEAVLQPREGIQLRNAIDSA